MNCDLCKREAKFEIYRMKENKWLRVCGWHDYHVGKENLMRQGLTQKEAIQISKEVKTVTI